MSDSIDNNGQKPSPGLTEQDLNPFNKNSPMGTLGSFINTGIALGAMSATVNIAGQAADMVQGFFAGQPPTVVGGMGGGALPQAMQNTIAGPPVNLTNTMTMNTPGLSGPRFTP